MGRYRGNRYRSYNKRSVGHERALEHIREAEALTRELGGTDKDVKSYFFSLSAAQLRSIFDKYESQYGNLAREYAEKTLPVTPPESMPLITRGFGVVKHSVLDGRQIAECIVR